MLLPDNHLNLVKGLLPSIFTKIMFITQNVPFFRKRSCKRNCCAMHVHIIHIKDNRRPIRLYRSNLCSGSKASPNSTVEITWLLFWQIIINICLQNILLPFFLQFKHHPYSLYLHKILFLVTRL